MERALSKQIKLNLGAYLLIRVGGFLQTMSNLELLVGIRLGGGVSWDRKNLEYECQQEALCATL